MAKIYFSDVLDWPAEDVWAVVRDFNAYPAYIDGVSESRIEDDKPGHAVGAVRCFVYRGLRVRQRLLAHSDAERFFTYGSCEPFAFPLPTEDQPVEPIDYDGTLRVKRIVKTGKAFVEGWVNFEGGGSRDRERWTGFFESGLRQWMASLDSHIGDARPNRDSAMP